MQKAFLVDSSICLGCNTCAMACKNQYHQDNGIAWRMVREIGGEEYREDQNNILPTVTWYAKAPKAHARRALLLFPSVQPLRKPCVCGSLSSRRASQRPYYRNRQARPRAVHWV